MAEDKSHILPIHEQLTCSHGDVRRAHACGGMAIGDEVSPIVSSGPWLFWGGQKSLEYNVIHDVRDFCLTWFIDGNQGPQNTLVAKMNEPITIF